MSGCGPRDKASFLFKLLNSDSCCRNMTGNIYGPHKVILIDRSDIAHSLHRLHFELVGFYSTSLCSSMAGNMIKAKSVHKMAPGKSSRSQAVPICVNLCDLGITIPGHIQGPDIWSLAEASSQHFAKILKGSCKVHFPGCTAIRLHLMILFCWH